MKKFVLLSIALLFAVAASAQQKTLSLGDANTPEAMHKQLYEQTVIVKNGEQFVDFTVEKYSGGSVKLSDYKGKVVYICFWGTWCPPCLRELKAEHLPAVLKPYLSNDDFVFLPVAQDDRAAADKFFASAKGAEYKWLSDYTCIDPGRKIFHTYAKSGIPRSVIIGKDGKVVETSIGANEYELELIAKTLKTLLVK